MIVLRTIAKKIMKPDKKTKIPKNILNRLILILCIFFISAYAIITDIWLPNDLPAWVQAISSIIGIGLSIWMPYRLYNKKEQYDIKKYKQETNRILLSIKFEIQLFITQLDDSIGKNLRENKPILDMTYPIEYFNFPIFDANRELIGRINNDKIREKIILCYSNFKSILGSIATNNKENKELEAAIEAIINNENREFYEKKRDHLWNELKILKTGIISRFDKAKSMAEDLIKCIDKMNIKKIHIDQ